MDLIYIPTAAIYLTVVENSSSSSSKNHDSNKTACIWMGQQVLLDTLAPGATARLNRRNINTISQLRVGDRIRAEGLMMIREEWTFLGNPDEDGTDEDSDNSDSDGDSNMSDPGDDESNGGDESSSSSSSDDDTKKVVASNYSSGVTKRAKAGGKSTGQSHEGGTKRAGKRAREPETSTQRKRTRATTSKSPADTISVKFHADCFDCLGTDEESRKKRDTDKGKTVTSSTFKGKRKTEDRDESDDKDNDSDDSEDMNVDSDDSDDLDEEDTQAKETKPPGSYQRKAPEAAKTAVIKGPTAATPSSGVDTNAFATVTADDARIKTVIRTTTVLTTAAAPSVHAVTAAAAMAMSNSVSKTMATVKRQQVKTGRSSRSTNKQRGSRRK
ncbi:hypothetical protein BGW39_010303 [Mortierella sp. 14UC]|nr:hypothetical protein BGW39_010303 [Mortierella sp. 14UC]